MAKGTKGRLKPPKRELPETVDDGDVSVVPLTTAIGAIIGNIVAPGIGGVFAGGLLGGMAGRSMDSKEEKMAKIPVFYTFHFDNDVMRVQQIRNIGTIEGNSPTTPNDWESLKRTGDSAVKNWIDENMKYKRCVIVLIGAQTAGRKWVNYEIEKAWNSGKALLGIYIHNLKCPRNGTSRKGLNPFDSFTFQNGQKLSSYIPCYDPNAVNAYQDVAINIASWIQYAITNKAN